MEKIIEVCTGSYQGHSSCKNYKGDPTTKKVSVSYSYLNKEHEMDYDVVDEDLVKQLVNLMK